MATNYARASYTEVVDLQTTNGKTSIIGIHTPVGMGPYARLRGFFTQFRKYRYKGISSLKMVPAANLPVDPLGLTGVIGTTDLMDPRDALNPILFHGCHGEHLGMILDTIYSNDEYTQNGGNYDAIKNVSDSTNENLVGNATSDLIGAYYRCLTDTTWRKFGIQSGVSLRGLHPLVWKMARNTPLLPCSVADTSATQNQISWNNAGELTQIRSEEGILGLDSPPDSCYYVEGGAQTAYGPLGQVPNVDVFGKDGKSFNPMYVQEMTTGVTGLGWLPTATIQSSSNVSALALTMLPKIFMGVLVLPPSYNVEQYFRMVIRHEFEFKDFTTSLGFLDMPNNTVYGGYTSNYFNWIDYDESKYADLIKDTNVGDTLDVVGGSSEIISDGVA